MGSVTYRIAEFWPVHNLLITPCMSSIDSLSDTDEEIANHVNFLIPLNFNILGLRLFLLVAIKTIW